MGNGKDITEKTLESYSDVFADIFNGLLFDGREVVRESELEDARTESQLKIAGEIHEQERDVAKYWKNGELRLAFCGLENQTQQDADMPLRVIGYDGASYKEQVNLHTSERRQRLPLTPAYPAVTLVLYFGETPWTAPRSLRERLDVLPAELAPYIQDYRIHVFEIAFLTPEQLKRFKSDFRLVADFVIQKRTKQDYDPPDDVIRHVDEVLKLLSAITGDQRLVDLEETLTEAEKEERTMCTIVDKWIQQGRQEGLQAGHPEVYQAGQQAGRQEGRQEGTMQTLGIMRDIRAGLNDEQILISHPDVPKELIEIVREACNPPS